MKGSRISVLVLLLLAATAPGAERGAPARVGVLFWHDSPNDARAWQGVQDGFRLAGLEWRPDVRDVNRDEDLARRILAAWEADGYDLVYAFGTEAALLAKETVTKTPVVFTAVTNPFGRGIVDSWEGSGTNLAGNSNWIPPPEVFRVFQSAVPGLARLGVVLNEQNPVSLEEVAEARRHFLAAPAKALKLLEEGIDGPDDLDRAVRRVLDRGAQAVWIPIDLDVYQNLERVSAVTMPLGIPLLASAGSAVETDAVVGVAVDYRTLGRNSVVYAKRILVDGADPGSMPIGRMRSFRVIVNLDAARRTGFTIPLPLLATADEILDVAGEVR